MNIIVLWDRQYNRFDQIRLLVEMNITPFTWTDPDSMRIGDNSDYLNMRIHMG